MSKFTDAEIEERRIFIKKIRAKYDRPSWAVVAKEIGITRQALYLFVKKYMKKTGE